MRFSFIALLVASGLACSGAIGPSASGEDSQAGAGPGPAAPGTPRAGENNTVGTPGTGPAAPGVRGNPGALPDVVLDKPGPRPLRRLTRDEINNTLRDLLGDSTSPADVLPAESRGENGFSDAGVVSTNDVGYLLQMAERAGRGAAGKLAAIVDCDPVAIGEQACVQRFVTKFGRRAFRRPLADREVMSLVGYFGEVKTALKMPFLDSVRVVLEAMLLSPSFLYQSELGAGPARMEGDLIRLSQHETASRLSYFLWRSMPDDVLFAAADAGTLTTPADIERESLRMLKDPRARQMISAFHVQWLGIDLLSSSPKDPKAFPEFGPVLARAMVDETAAFAVRSLFEGDGTFKSLLVSNAATVDAPLAKLYGMVPGSTGAVMLDPAQRAGLLTRAAFLSVKASPVASHPVKRGHKIYTGLLCGSVPPPPDMVAAPVAPPPGVSTRESFAAHAQNACAAGCHSLFDPLGFAFENYDALGKYRTMDGGKPVDATGVFRSPSGNVQPFRDAVELMKILAAAPEARACMLRQWLRFGLGRVEVPGDEASLLGAIKGFAAGDGDERAAISALARSRTFLYRSPSPGEVVQ